MQVNHSQKLSEKPLTPWVISEVSGKILAAHCDCTAGLGETCSHVSSLLWVVATGVEKRDSLTVTQKSAYWVMPPAIRSVPLAPLKEIDFIGKKRKSSSALQSASHSGSTVTAKQRKLVVPTYKEQNRFLDLLASSKDARPVVLSLVAGHCEKFIPSALSLDLPLVLTDLHKPSYTTLSYFELLDLASATVDTITVTTEQVLAVERNTRDQSRSRLWFRMRAGRVTASRFKSVCSTDPASPSLSLVMSLCHPDKVRFRTAATTWGCQHEKTALEQYKQSSPHNQLSVFPSGFFISVDHPYFGASPDGLVCCTCCGTGILEIKVCAAIMLTLIDRCTFYFSALTVIRMIP